MPFAGEEILAFVFSHRMHARLACRASQARACKRCEKTKAIPRRPAAAAVFARARARARAGGGGLSLIVGIFLSGFNQQ